MCTNSRFDSPGAETAGTTTSWSVHAEVLATPSENLTQRWSSEDELAGFLLCLALHLKLIRLLSLKLHPFPIRLAHVFDLRFFQVDLTVDWQALRTGPSQQHGGDTATGLRTFGFLLF